MNEKNQKINHKSTGEGKIKKIFRKMGNALVYTMIAITIVICIRALVFKKYDILGYKAYIVMSGSMEIAINATDVVITNAQVDNFKIGDIIAFQDDNVITVHRIVDSYTDGKGVLYRTKGDNNNTIDQKMVKSSEIKGKVVHKIAKLGKLILFIRSHIIIFIFSIALIIIIIIARRLM